MMVAASDTSIRRQLTALSLEPAALAALLDALPRLRSIPAAAEAKALHELLKSCGIKSLGARLKVAVALEQTKPEAEALAASLCVALEQRGLSEHCAQLAPYAETLQECFVASSSPKALHDLLKSSLGIKALGRRQQIWMAISPVFGKRHDVTSTAIGRPEPPPPAAAAAASKSDDEDDAGLALEENEEVLQPVDDDDDDDDFLVMETNNGEESDPDDFLIIETNGQEAVAKEELQYSSREERLRVELCAPPTLPPVQPIARDPSDPIEGALIAGITGSKGLKRSALVPELLTYKTKPPEEGQAVDKLRMQRVFDLCSSLILNFSSKCLLDVRWRQAFTATAAAIGKARAPSALPFGSGTGAALGGGALASLSLESMLDSMEGREQRVCVLGLGSGVPALVAARAGAQVVWAERVDRLGDVAQRLVERNRLAKRVQVLTGDVQEWEDLAWGGEGGASGGAAAPAGTSLVTERFDSVITEELSDDLLSDGLVQLATLAKRSLLKPGGTFYPRSATVYAALASIRTTDCCGFDVRAFNAFRHTDGEPVYDFEEVLLNEHGVATMLSEPVRLFSLNFNSDHLDALAAASSETVEAHVTCPSDAAFNVIVCWYDLDMGPSAGKRVSFAPNHDNPRHMYTRAVKQRLFFTAYERRVRKGDRVQLALTRTPDGFSVSAPPDAEAERLGLLVRWPIANVLSYHFPMIAEAPRNIKFERALLRAIDAYKLANHGRGPHVLDIGSGTGLLAMMAARGGARQVTSVEMVPALCDVAREIVKRNGYEDVISVLNIRSDELSDYAMGGERADLLVSELLDDHLIGDGVIASVLDARRRLLTPQAMVVPRAGRLFVLPVSLRAKGPHGIDLDDLNRVRCDQCVLSYPFYSAKLQQVARDEYDVLGDALEVFDFDWASAPLNEEEGAPGLEVGRTSAPMPLRFTRGGIFNALVLFFTLQMDATPGMAAKAAAEGGGEAEDYSSGLDNKDTHWDQPVRFLPLELQVQQGDVLTLVATHSPHDLSQMTLYGVTDEMSHGMVGTPHLVDSTVGGKLGVHLSRKAAPPPPKGQK